MWTYEDLMKLSPDDFERILADLWRAMGYTVTVVGGPGDRGLDILATMEKGVRFTVGIQAKRYGPTNKVDVHQIREYASLLAKHEVDSVVVVSTSGFTEGALKEAKELNVKTIDGEQLLALLNQHHIPRPFPVPSVSLPQSFSVEEKRVTPSPEKSSTGKQILKNPGLWAVVLLVYAIAGFTALANEGFNAGMFVLYLFCFFIGLGLGCNYLERKQKLRDLQNYLGLSEHEAQKLISCGFDSITKISNTNPETLALHLGCDLPRAYEIIHRARTSPKRVEESIIRSSWVTDREFKIMLSYVNTDEKAIGVLAGRLPDTHASCILLFTDRRIIVAKALNGELIATGNPQRPIDVQVISERYANITFEDLNSEKKHSVLRVSRPHLEKVLKHYHHETRSSQEGHPS